MATNDKKYLDLVGLSSLIDKLNTDKRIVAHPSTAPYSPAAVKIGHDADGHVVVGNPLEYSDLQNLPEINNGTLTIKAMGTTKGIFTANQKDDTEINITLEDFGIPNVMHFVGTTTTDISDGATTASIIIQGQAHAATSGDVVLYNSKEFVWNGSSWEELGDEGSHALKTIKVIAGDGLAGGGTLETDLTISHDASKAPVTASPVAVGMDKFGHVIIGTGLTTAQDGKHSHSVTSTIDKDAFLKSASATTTKISLNKSNDSFIKSYTGVTSKLVTTTITGTNGTVTASKATAGNAVAVATTGTPVVYGTADVGSTATVAIKADSATTVGNANIGAAITITGVSGSTTASKATAGSAVAVAKTGTAVIYGTADCGDTVSGIAKVGKQITYGNANVGVAESVAVGVQSATAEVVQDAYTASYSDNDECLTLTPATISVTPTVTLNTTTIAPAVASSATAHVCADGVGVEIIPAAAAPETQKITPAVSNGTIIPYTFSDVTVPQADATATTFNPAAASSTTIFGVKDTVEVTSAIAADTSRTVTPAKSNGTITPYTFTDVVAAKKADSATTVATGDLATDGEGDNVLVSLGDAETATAITSASIQSSASTGDVTVATGIATTKYETDITINGTATEAGEHNHTVQ